EARPAGAHRAMSRSSGAFLLVLCLIAPLPAAAQPVQDRVAFGNTVHVAAGEVVQDAVAFGGDVIVDGEVRGDAVSFGGAVELRGAGRVGGDATSFGGEVRDGGAHTESGEVYGPARG